MIEDPLIGYQLGAYRIERLIGRGGMAQVYYGTDLNLQRAVAIKVIDTRFRNDPGYAQRLVQEARVVAAWRHENILQVYAAGEDNGLYYFVMEYIDGLDLGQIMAGFAQDKELMPLADVLRISKAVADALDYAHRRQVIHRDVKPSNVMVAKDGRIVLMDFGLALNVQQGSLGETFGTPHYIAPEQAVNSAQAVPQSDIYALGVILYEMLTGAVPFNDPSTMAVIMQHITLPPPPPRVINPNLNLATEAVLLKALSKKPADRYQNGMALAEALAKALEEPSETAVSAVSPSAEPSFLAAPPLPAGMKPTPPRPISRQTVAERVSLYQPPPMVVPTPKAATPPLTPAPPLPTSKPISPPPTKLPGWLLAVGGAILFLLVAWGIASLLIEDETETAVSASPSPFSTATELVVTASTEPATAEPATATADTPLATDTVPSAPPTETAVPTAAPTETIIVAATETAVSASPTSPPVAAPTVLYPNGKRILLLYDANSFYLWNSTAERIAIRSIDFENIDANGNFAGYFFDGSLWTQFYSYVEDQSCVRIELLRAPAYLRPPLCRAYNATVTPDPDDAAVFWLPRSGITQFRVLWDNQEIARCEVNAGQCELFLP